MTHDLNFLCTALEAYVGAARDNSDFYTRSRIWTRVGAAVRRGVDEILERLGERFSTEDLMRFFNRSRQWPDFQRTAGHLLDARDRLLERLLARICDDSDDRIEGGLVAQTRGIQRTTQGYVIKTTLLDGRLRRFSKRIQTFSGPDLELFFPTLREVSRHVGQRLQSDTHLDKTMRTYLEQVHQTLDTMRTVLAFRVRPGQAGPDESPLWSAIRDALSSVDVDKLLLD